MHFRMQIRVLNFAEKTVCPKTLPDIPVRICIVCLKMTLAQFSFFKQRNYIKT